MKLNDLNLLASYFNNIGLLIKSLSHFENDYTLLSLQS